ncbi:MAG: SufS family cysteine desulfurase [Candidatus Pacebacteria bacterium]|nr:SufS family cysteine desulfurase [Candidatus Paceibacterota bacterium]PIR59869.1 MAG: cysteine desulfurase [Candidatus Pacebacteria bacterium CG10_big_fil_rev_8_21_14_0_10_44_54]
MFNPKTIRSDFPIFTHNPLGERLVYLDSAATSQKPQVVLDAILQYYQTTNANVHRGVHQLSDKSTQTWDDSRATIANFFDAKTDELIITRNTTEAINGVAYGWGEHNLSEGDVIVATLMEHHANIVCWQELARRTGARLEFVTLAKDGRLNQKSLRENLSLPKVKLLALTHVSNTLGTLNPIAEIIAEARALQPNIRVLIDAAQSAPHIPVSFTKLDADFLVFSGHKMLGPMGIGGVFVRSTLLQSNQMRPWLFGGGMIAAVTTTATTFTDEVSERFTAGTPDVASAVGLATACKYLSKLHMQDVGQRDLELVLYALEKLGEVPEIEIIGPQDFASSEVDRVGSVAFIYKGMHAHDVAQVLDSVGVAVRSGHHCTMPLHQQFGWAASVRASFNVYNTKQDVDALVAGLNKVRQVFNR